MKMLSSRNNFCVLSEGGIKSNNWIVESVKQKEKDKKFKIFLEINRDCTPPPPTENFLLSTHIKVSPWSFSAGLYSTHPTKYILGESSIVQQSNKNAEWDLYILKIQVITVNLNITFTIFPLPQYFTGYLIH